MNNYKEFKPKPLKIKNLSVAVTAKMHHELLEIGKRRNLTISQMLTDAINMYIWMCNDDE